MPVSDTGPIMCIWCEEIFLTKNALRIHQMDTCQKNPMANLLAENLKKRHRIKELETRAEVLEARIAELEGSE